MRLVRLGAPSRIYPVRTDRGLPEKMVFGLAPPACMLQAILSQIKAVGPSQSGGKAQIMGHKRRDHQMTSAATKDDSIYHSGRGHRRRGRVGIYTSFGPSIPVYTCIYTDTRIYGLNTYDD